MEKKQNLVIWCGRVENGKKIDRMLWIWKRIKDSFPDWNLKVLGGGNITYYKTLSDEYLGDDARIEFVGFQHPKPYYDKAKVLCMTSCTEGWGMVLVESQRHGCVPISYDSFASVTDIITDGKNGCIVSTEKEYVQKLSRVMSDNDYRKRMAREGFKSHFEAGEIADRWIKLFESL